MRLPRLREVYDRVEKRASPVVNAVVRSEDLARLVVLLGAVEKETRGRATRLTARAWHLVNLPAGTDVQRLKVQLGALDREIRLLALKLEMQRDREVTARGGDPAQTGDDQSSTP